MHTYNEKISIYLVQRAIKWDYYNSLAQSQHSLAQSQHSLAQQPTMHTLHNLNSSQTHHAFVSFQSNITLNIHSI